MNETAALTLDNFDSCDFFTLKNGVMCWNGYFYHNGEGWRLLEYCGFENSVEDFVNVHHNDPNEAYEDLGASQSQYICGENERPEWTEDWFYEQFSIWIEGVTVIAAEDINKNTPDGCYVIAPKSRKGN